MIEIQGGGVVDEHVIVATIRQLFDALLEHHGIEGDEVAELQGDLEELLNGVVHR